MGLHCNQCHIVKAHHSIGLNDTTCRGCHNLSVIALTMTEMPASFNHEGHAAMFGCKDCHSGAFRMKANSERITMEKIAQGKACGACHDGQMAFAPDNCSACHGG